MAWALLLVTSSLALFREWAEKRTEEVPPPPQAVVPITSDTDVMIVCTQELVRRCEEALQALEAARRTSTPEDDLEADAAIRKVTSDMSELIRLRPESGLPR